MQQPESNGPALKTCQTGTHAICVIDLQANSQGKTVSPLVLHAVVHSELVLTDQNSPHFGITSRQPRSSTNPTPLITALRV